MKTAVILTPSFLPDIVSFERLHASVLRHADESIMHHVIVPKRDLEAFQAIKSHRLQVWSENEFLPTGFVATGSISALGRRLPFWPRTLNCSAINLRYPWPPLRGWVLQQILKLSAATQLGSDCIVIIDSDVVLIKKLNASQFYSGATVRLYEQPAVVHEGMARHRVWTRVAREMLGLCGTDDATFPDYVGGIVSWDPALVRDCLHRVETVSGIPWASALSKQLHFSEFILYGTYVRNFGTLEQQSYVKPNTLCHSYWSPIPLDRSGASRFIEAYDKNDIAVHIQSNSETPQEIIAGIVNHLSEEQRS
ncbi:hypothetical protein CQ018_14070 [Arthrobacter sp. MYb227]|uniref:DUF6492 family protein n=1 Tax=Arthrobacter sp. MYb227 TaxID=1848601 RepID=UPI000CFB91F1|nr:DUF6492 family protein [Arthrobacter sp. MYb227]PQZ91088.1 hypothetical protein CQ018_14070 [Arthrobacter sp. MYb227]